MVRSNAVKVPVVAVNNRNRVARESMLGLLLIKSHAAELTSLQDAKKQ